MPVTLPRELYLQRLRMKRYGWNDDLKEDDHRERLYLEQKWLEKVMFITRKVQSEDEKAFELHVFTIRLLKHVQLQRIYSHKRKWVVE